MQILLADDDSITRRLLTRTLQRAGHQIESAVDGRAAWARLQEEYFQVLIVDWVMPHLDGPSLIRKVRDHSFPGYVYTILLTSRQTQDDRLDGLEAGADDYLIKPVDIRELQARLMVAKRILDLEAQLREVNSRLTYQASHDRLTELFNRPAIMEYAETQLARAQRHGHPLSLALFDLDHFKAINDSHGHLVGDAALCHVATSIASQVRPYDWVGRWGGEEFLVVLPDAGTDEALLVAERIRAGVAAAPMALATGEQVKLTISAGVACASGRGTITLDILFHEADAALYAAKAAGRNRVARGGPERIAVGEQPTAEGQP
jgi:two-component system chemotaxis response regulator CheY